MNKDIAGRYVYMMYIPKLKIYKLGFSNNPYKRLDAISISNPFNVILVFAMKDDNASSIESRLHMLYKNYRIKGEWFNLDFGHALECIGMIMSRKIPFVYRGIDDIENYIVNKKWLNFIISKQECEWYDKKIMSFLKGE